MDYRPSKDTVQCGQSVLEKYETYWREIKKHQLYTAGAAKTAEAEMQPLLNFWRRVNGDWKTLQAELEGVSTLQKHVDIVCGNIEKVCQKVDRAELALDKVLELRDERELEQWQQDRERELSVEQEASQRDLVQLRGKLGRERAQLQSKLKPKALPATPITPTSAKGRAVQTAEVAATEEQAAAQEAAAAEEEGAKGGAQEGGAQKEEETKDEEQAKPAAEESGESGKEATAQDAAEDGAGAAAQHVDPAASGL